MVVFQQAKLQWLLGDTRQAVDALCREESKFRGTKAATRDLYRKVVLCLGGWYEISGERNTEQMINHYESLAKVHKKYAVGRFCNSSPLTPTPGTRTFCSPLPNTMIRF